MTVSPQFREAWLLLDRQRWPVPWLVSLTVHLAALILLALIVHVNAPRGTAISLESSLLSEGKASRFADEQAGGSSTAVTMPTASQPAEPTTVSTRSPLDELLDQVPSVDPTQALPSQQLPIGPAALEGGGVGQGLGTTRGTGAGGGQGLQGLGAGKATTSIFGVRAEGFRFVYVFDRSASTGGPGRGILDAAKAELIASINSLDKIHQFGIIFYNQQPSVFTPDGQRRLVFATEQYKERARSFVNSIVSDGATAHEEALSLAIKLQPDVIFFLTDGDEPKLLPHQLQKIHKMAAGIKINAIEFGFGPQPEANGFLAQLARQNEGQYAYIDVTKLPPSRP